MSQRLLGPRPSRPGHSRLLNVLRARGWVSEWHVDVLRKEIARCKAEGARFIVACEKSNLLGQILVGACHITPKQLADALTLQERVRGFGGTLRLGEVLLELGFATPEGLENALRGQAAALAMACSTCRAPYRVPFHDPGQTYLCCRCSDRLAGPDAASVVIPEILREETSADNLVGNYVLVAELGRGGMGVVHKAWDRAHRRWVALKVVTDHGRLEEMARLRREVDIVKSLHHPNIVAIYDLASLGTRHLIAMQLVEGRTLSGLLLPVDRAVKIVSTVAHAVQYAHSRGVIHRDIKPQNIMVDESGKPFLVDFGLAKTAEEAKCVTSVGLAMGTPGYMAPEQAIGRSSRVDRRSDVYALGAVLYDLLVGRPPFRGASPVETLQQVVSQEVLPPTQYDPRISKSLEAIVLKCLMKDKNHRYQTAAQLAEELEGFRAGCGS